MGANLDITEKLQNYINNFGLNLHPVQQEIINYNKTLGDIKRMQIDPTQCHFLHLIIKVSNIKNVLEIGTFTGLSALTISLALPDDGKLIALDKNEETNKIACDFFKEIPKIYNKLKTLKDVGLGYLKLGQPSTTISGGEAQRVKLASELSKKDTGNTLYILDEPTTGLHFEDIRVLLEVLNKLVEKGNTVLIIEHNLDVIKQVDYIIDIGPEGGKNGGKIVCNGTPEEIIKVKNSYTSKFLKKEIC